MNTEQSTTMNELANATAGAAKSLRAFRKEYDRGEKAQERHAHCFWKAYPIIQNDPELLEATMRREEEHR